MFSEFDLNSEENTPNEINQFFENNLTCKVTGTIDASKVSGQLLFYIQPIAKGISKWKEDNKGEYKM